VGLVQQTKKIKKIKLINMNRYTREEVYNECIKYFNGDQLAADVWINKYALKDFEGNIYEKSPIDMHKRISKEFTRIEQKYKNPLSENSIFELIKDFKYIVPQGSPMAGIGNNLQTISLSNCFVIGNKADSYGGIVKIDEEQTQLMKRRGGVGHDLSHIRPKGVEVKNSALTSTGVVPFMERYSNSTREVAQDGRRGALMLSIDVRHLDVEDFIDAKLEKEKVTGANISVKLNDDFIKAAINDKTYIQQFPIDSDNPLIKQEVNAKKIWDKIINNAWKSAEPGVFFWDTIIRESVPDCYKDYGFQTVTSNPCSEIMLCPYDSCRLLGLNLFNYVENPFTKNAKFNFKLLQQHTRIAQRLLDDLIDLEIEKIDAILKKIDNDPEDISIKQTEINLWKKIKEKTLLGRRTGLGSTAEGDMIAALGLKYGSDEAIKISEKVHKTIALNSYIESINLAKERGKFEICDPDLEQDNPFIKRILKNLTPEQKADYYKYGRRNIANLTLAPSGSVSLMTQTTSGIEPLFSVKYNRRRKINPNDKNVNNKNKFVDQNNDSWEEYTIFHPKFRQWAKINNIDLNELNDEELNKVIEKSPYYNATANQIDSDSKVKLQGTIQKWIDHSISITISLPESATTDDVDSIYKKGWEYGCKGLTIYREGSRSGVLVEHNKDSTNENMCITKYNAPKRPRELPCDVHQLTVKGEKWMVFVGILGNDPYEVFSFKKNGLTLPNSTTEGTMIRKKSGFYTFRTEDGLELDNVKNYFEQDEQEALTRIISTSLRHGTDIKFIIEQLNKAEGNITSFSKAIARTLKKYIDELRIKDTTCERCNDPEGLVYEEGCLKCKSCGYSKC